MIKLKNETKPKDNQDLFSRVWQHFVVEKNPQSKAATDEGASCLYRSKDGNGCAIGCVLPDKIAEKADAMEYGSLSIQPLLCLEKNTKTDIVEWLSNVSPVLAARLQFIHDGYFIDFEAQMRKLAGEFSLYIPNQQ